MSITLFAKRHPVLTYFFLTFAISCGGFIIVAGPGGIPGNAKEIDKLFPVFLATLLTSPITAGIISTGLVSGKGGYRELLLKFSKWRVGIKWYLIALIVTPSLISAILLVLSLFSSTFLPEILTTRRRGSLLLTPLIVGLMGGTFEEIGWTGFAVPNLRTYYSVVTVGLIVGGMAYTGDILGKCGFLWCSFSVTLSTSSGFLRFGATGLSGAHGMGL